MMSIDKKAEAKREVQEDYQKQIQKLENDKKNMSEAQKREIQRLIDEYTIKIEIINVSDYNPKGDVDDSIIVADGNIMNSRTLIQRHLEAYMQNYFPNMQKENAQTFYEEMVKEIKEDCNDRLLSKKRSVLDIRND